MAAEPTELVKDSNKDCVEMSPKNDADSGRDWVSFKEKDEVPLLPQPPSQRDNLQSDKYIDRLEQKLHRMKDLSNLTSKSIVSALAEARENQMNNMINAETRSTFISSATETHTDLNWNDDIAEPRCCCILMYTHLFPKRAKTTQELECLLDEDELAIRNSELDEVDFSTHQPLIP